MPQGCHTHGPNPWGQAPRRFLMFALAVLALVALAALADIEPGHDRPIARYWKIGQVVTYDRENQISGEIFPLYVQLPVNALPVGILPGHATITLHTQQPDGRMDRTTYTLYLQK